MVSMISKIFKKQKNVARHIKAQPLEPFYGQSIKMQNYSSFCREGYSKNVIVFKAINLISSSLASIPVVIYRKTSKGQVRLKEHPIAQITTNPNPFTSRTEFFENIAAYKLLSGNCFVLKLGEDLPIELYTLRPDRVRIVTDDNNTLIGYQYLVGEKTNL